MDVNVNREGRNDLLGSSLLLVESYMWSIALYGTETLTLPKLDQKCMQNF